LRKGVKFHDGTPVTAEDVKFSFDAVRDPRYKAARLLPYFENIESAEVVDPHTVKFNIKKKYFGNLAVLAEMYIVPKSFYGDPEKKLNKVIMGSGPYKIHKYDRGRSLTLVRNPDWFGYKLDHLKDTRNFDFVRYRFIKEDNTVLEMLKKGKLDYNALTPEQFVKKTEGKPWGETVFAEKIRNSAPKGYGFVALNLKNPRFKDRKTRLALAHLMNRKLMNEKFRYNLSEPTPGPWYPQSPYASPKVKPIEFSPKKAATLLKQAGWSDSNKDGVLDKVVDGETIKLEFTLLNPSKDAEKYFTMYKEDLKKAGVILNIENIDFNSMISLVDERKFDALTMAWSAGSVDNDPKQIWHSSSAREGGSNFISYSNPKVDKLIDEGRAELDREKRIKIYHKIYELIAADAPYIFMFNQDYQMYAHSDDVEFDKPTLEYAVGVKNWRPAQKAKLN
jgi:microcin C transport system substrate-binding protein